MLFAAYSYLIIIIYLFVCLLYKHFKPNNYLINHMKSSSMFGSNSSLGILFSISFASFAISLGSFFFGFCSPHSSSSSSLSTFRPPSAPSTLHFPFLLFLTMSSSSSSRSLTVHSDLTVCMNLSIWLIFLTPCSTLTSRLSWNETCPGFMPLLFIRFVAGVRTTSTAGCLVPSIDPSLQIWQQMSVSFRGALLSPSWRTTYACGLEYLSTWCQRSVSPV